ncbi:G-type lectin S-receptor-like serine/threonine-protein kinase SD2-5 [Actinidia eriantha]|uniref:G-type lectin S-receptor-like serine/threonine-protein kinase SD2-5 n=1 Tax=Actinidia eriantha TaxID=165200 RepID=UPI002583E6A3|nr:G-type lectin S-receptor-like serine/threonine-protein kinase SD2-5 [Actinidia eriantha]XP_057465096.1 G-type lectin S-receptor-like serine/threonine-protein kinase SD2-5 [Actinidia eriantha]XP_057465097.1 G-type lectin S-receptor-like serine/threonine-protein kinase SD2-5 [Actinidia eriantha]
MATTGCPNYDIKFLWFCALLVFDLCTARTPRVGQISPGFEASQMDFIDHDGLFLLSNNSVFALKFYTVLDVTVFLLGVIHIRSTKVVWTANRESPVRNTGQFVFDTNGDVYLKNETNVVWSTDTEGKGVEYIELQDTGNLVLLGANRRVLWQSFSYPTNTLLSEQVFVEGMKLKSFPYHSRLYHYLEIKSGDLIMTVGYRTPQVYWSMATDTSKTVKKPNGKVSSASIVANSWNFYDRNQSLVWQFNISQFNDPNATWAATLNAEGSISFYNLERGKPPNPELTKIPQNLCGIPEPCYPYNVCSFDVQCQCPSVLNTRPNCMPQLNIPCNSSNSGIDLVYLGEQINYFALGFVAPNLETHLDGCKEACGRNCSCRVLFFDNTSGNCFLFDQIGSLQRANPSSTGFISYIKVPKEKDIGKKGKKHIVFPVIISVATVVAIVGLLYLGFQFGLKKKEILKPAEETSEEDNFLDTVSKSPVRFSYSDLCIATKSFSVKLGQGGFGSVYEGMLLDGTRVAVKKLEGIGQGRKEFRAEVSIIGNIHHVHLVNLKGFCAEGTHRLLVYEYMGKGSLDRWIFRNKREGRMLDWETRFNIALGTAKGLAYLHEECDVKIVHCDIKPENVLLDDNFLAKVSDFGMAKLMTREQSQVYTVVRGTRGYLAPEWLTNHAISEKSDVYSFGLVLFEIIRGRKNYNPGESSEKAHFPSYAFKMMEERKLNEIFDPNLEIDEDDETVLSAIKVALWCIQDEMHMRPTMSKVVQMLQGLCAVPEPPTAAQVSSRLYSSFFKSSTEDPISSGSTDYNSATLLSNVHLSGPR